MVGAANPLCTVHMLLLLVFTFLYRMIKIGASGLSGPGPLIRGYGEARGMVDYGRKRLIATN